MEWERDRDKLLSPDRHRPTSLPRLVWLPGATYRRGCCRRYAFADGFRIHQRNRVHDSLSEIVLEISTTRRAVFSSLILLWLGHRTIQRLLWENKRCGLLLPAILICSFGNQFHEGGG